MFKMDKIKLLKQAIEKYEGERMTLDVLLIGLKTELALLERKEKDVPSTKPIILDDNPISIAKYAEEFPENWKAMTNNIPANTIPQVKSSGGHFISSTNSALPTKAQMNWEVGKERQDKFLENWKVVFDGEKLEEIKELFAEIRQNEYRRGKEDGLKENASQSKSELKEKGKVYIGGSI
jgi:hypothetical protein